ncbi:PH and SEC7 domain-containing protein 1-like isoform X1 [Hemicordylus capensis]|uniref:PH and SEC7 domain-containing protein 1-like isoform X1 n=1 Tax=Hemicordylus capensis TaxID=884348 RepID=UPI002303F69C|nr:PH and SEC7 domain-containing protein 1-like isoform X1 [Hemicordylus capensis]
MELQGAEEPHTPELAAPRSMQEPPQQQLLMAAGQDRPRAPLRKAEIRRPICRPPAAAFTERKNRATVWTGPWRGLANPGGIHTVLLLARIMRGGAWRRGQRRPAELQQQQAGSRLCLQPSPPTGGGWYEVACLPACLPRRLLFHCCCRCWARGLSRGPRTPVHARAFLPLQRSRRVPPGPPARPRPWQAKLLLLLLLLLPARRSFDGGKREARCCRTGRAPRGGGPPSPWPTPPSRSPPPRSHVPPSTPGRAGQGRADGGGAGGGGASRAPPRPPERPPDRAAASAGRPLRGGGSALPAAGRGAPRALPGRHTAGSGVPGGPRSSPGTARPSRLHPAARLGGRPGGGLLHPPELAGRRREEDALASLPPPPPPPPPPPAGAALPSGRARQEGETGGRAGERRPRGPHLGLQLPVGTCPGGPPPPPPPPRSELPAAAPGGPFLGGGSSRRPRGTEGGQSLARSGRGAASSPRRGPFWAGFPATCSDGLLRPWRRSRGPHRKGVLSGQPRQVGPPSPASSSRRQQQQQQRSPGSSPGGGAREENTPSPSSLSEAPSCFPVLLTHGPSGSLLDSTTAGPTLGGTDLPGGGLLFSASSTCLVSALLHDDHDDDGPPSPGELSWPPSSSQVFSAPPSLWPENAPHASPSPSCTWVEAPERTSCLEEEAAAAAAAAARDLLSASLGAVARELECSAEGLEMVQVPPLQGQEAEEAEEEEAAPAPPRPEELPPGPSETGEPLNPKEQQPEPNGLLANGTSGDQAAARRLAARLYRLDGFKRSQVASFLRKNNEFSRQVAEAFLSFFQFSGKTLDQALRLFLKAFVLTGETQERERILRHFSQRYHACNPEAFLGPDAVHTLTCAIMLLNTDLHGQHAGRSMTCQEFLTNLEGLNSGQNFSKEQLKVLYSSIRQEKLEWAVDEDEAPGPATPQPAAPSRKKNNPFLTLQHHPGAETYRQGLLARKVHAEADGKKTPWGKRGWKVFHTVLKGMVLCFCKDEGQPDGAEEPLGVHHALAEKASKYTKRPNVFRLQTADWRIFLFQAPTPEEMHSWISRINLAAAMFSSPPFPAAVGSQRKFIRPILPTAPCRSSLEDQHQAHEDWMDKMSDDLLEHQRNLPDKRGRGRDLEEYQLKKEYLLYEKRRYETYVRLLEVKLSSATEDLDQWEARLREAESAEEESAGLKKSHSSPSLNVDGLPAGGVGVKVKRNISERRTVRRVIPRRHKHLL